MSEVEGMKRTTSRHSRTWDLIEGEARMGCPSGQWRGEASKGGEGEGKERL